MLDHGLRALAPRQAQRVHVSRTTTASSTPSTAARCHLEQRSSGPASSTNARRTRTAKLPATKSASSRKDSPIGRTSTLTGMTLIRLSGSRTASYASTASRILVKPSSSRATVHCRSNGGIFLSHARTSRSSYSALATPSVEPPQCQCSRTCNSLLLEDHHQPTPAVHS